MSLFVLLSILASSLNYTIYPTLAHILPSNQYVNIVVALSLFTQIATFLASSIAITVGLTKAHGKERAASEIEFLQKVLFRIFAVIILVFLLISPFLVNKLHIPLLFNVPISLMMVVAIPLAIISGFFNGHGKLVQLGLITAISASAQLFVAILVAYLTKSGVWTMVSMALAQILTIIIIYRIFRKEGLPKIFGAPEAKIVRSRNYVKNLVLFTIFSSLAVMAINILQIGDLLIIKSLDNKEIKFYTDIYIISRIVFFAGTIFIWPFLAQISLSDKKNNRTALLKLIGIFSVISALTLMAMAVFGKEIVRLLFGSTYSASSVLLTSFLSIIYKLDFLIITAVVLYFTVFRSYKAIVLSLLSIISIFTYSLLINSSASINQVLVSLDIISATIVCVSIGFFIQQKI